MFILSLSYQYDLILPKGAFGAANPAQNNATNPIFGGAKPAGGFGAFGGGGTGAFGTTGGAFGQPATTTPATGTGVFGQNTNTTGAFGGNSLFGKPATGVFGAAASKLPRSHHLGYILAYYK